ncbi:MAG TPA: acyl-ACP--UDP-N-acetylglucosamine O-acyltransferase [Caulobacteraceae bacterium]|jgi:UDP-N-acetylglucosamine acyltransferase|nr:acyl-ACP--UDP-N-acetylglucosamine O-acyltransferase [Caulobacteraceae bacterium]
MNIHATALVAPGAELASDVEIGPYCTIGPKVKLASGVRLHGHVVIDGETEVGEGCEIFPFAVLGGPPQHAVYKPTDPVRLTIGARNLIREHVTVNGGSSVGRGITRIGNDSTFYMGAHVGHDCIVGDHVTMTNNATLGGHVVLADYVILGGLAAIQQRSRVGRYAFIGGLAAVNSDVIPYGMVWGNHASLHGLNLIGLKRRGFSRDQINALRAGYRALFGSTDGAFLDRVAAVTDKFSASAEVLEIIDFIRAEPQRPLVQPAREAAGGG